VRACAELPKLCEFFHIPFQSGDDDILRAMKRGYTAERYRGIIDNIRRYMPDASISGDVIVGFPGAPRAQAAGGGGRRRAAAGGSTPLHAPLCRPLTLAPPPLRPHPPPPNPPHHTP
jgi:radical SAM superfamily enzyme YgiQ (UPF0313 family)